MQTRTPDPDAKRDYLVNWGAKWLVGDDTLATSTWSADTGLTIESSTNTTTTTTVWLSGGVAGTSYLVTNHVVSTAGREDDFTFVLQIGEQ
jgi:hypothetical protein